MDLLQTSHVYCPYCGESIEILVDISTGEQEYVEDCQVCCEPVVINISFADTENIRVDVRRENL